MIELGEVTIRTTVVRETPFVCPYCGLDRVGVEVEPQRWLTAFGMPVLPLATLDHKVRCESCKHLCDMAVLDVPTTQQLDQYLRDATRLNVIAVLRAQSSRPGFALAPLARERAVAVVAAVEPWYCGDDLTMDLDTEAPAYAAVTRLLAHDLSLHGKQNLLRRLAEVAECVGPLTDEARRVLIDIGIALDMSAANINGVLTVADLNRRAA